MLIMHTSDLSVINLGLVFRIGPGSGSASYKKKSDPDRHLGTATKNHDLLVPRKKKLKNFK
jgi:hypothetical protein